jgi:hypothetical protein
MDGTLPIFHFLKLQGRGTSNYTPGLNRDGFFGPERIERKYIIGT